MTGPKGNSEFFFFFLRPSMFLEAKAEVTAKGNIEVEGKQNSLFPTGPVIKCFVEPPNSKIEKKTA